MGRDRFDRVLLALLALTVTSLALLLSGAMATGEGSPRHAPGLEKAMERQLAMQARVAFLEGIYAPVEVLRKADQSSQALLKLEELSRLYPGEAHGHLLKGEILSQQGVLDEAVASYVTALRLSGDYLDEQSPLSRRAEIRQLVDDGLHIVGARARANPDNRSLAASLKNVYYLQSRLAGGCE
jgi:cytochrome c-type biogenesis protein CcmH/NrfG